MNRTELTEKLAEKVKLYSIYHEQEINDRLILKIMDEFKPEILALNIKGMDWMVFGNEIKSLLDH